ncbi:hypothetical protein FXV83_15150 [Bradyrhizobium hipponense]|uniref:Uncharacterized protein n=1 Tax=Bradyrhizobium hipponense TaxID=2605638 RepID=A0A5S4YMV0_9BRAD|nr:hypothetical protein [Bradyrhizobium hipponense]TYO65751.1 hypothetical protein FXV83_15150 [Bradyrhizobium hipponense]
MERATAIGRAIREAGLIRTSGRGTSAAQMDERDAVNLLIGVNVADTARSAPGAVAQYRALLAKRRNRTSEFGGELEELLSAAKRECLADYVMKTVTLLGAQGHVLGRKRFTNEAYRFEIEFGKPLPSVVLGIWGPNRQNAYIDFFGRQPIDEVHGDRKERTRITERTIRAVADVLRIRSEA